MSRVPPPPTTSSVLYVGSIPYEWTEETVKTVVYGSGKVVDVRIGMDSPIKNKGFCFIEYADPSEAQKAYGLLQQIRMDGRKKLRVEISKEGLRTGGNTKPELQVDHSLLPSNVVLPPEMMVGRPNIVHNQIAVVPQQYVASPVAQPTGLPEPTALPFVARDKISENLSVLPPTQLVELITSLKTILSGPNVAQAAEIFRLYPNLATAAAQALLLMGFVDADVIAESARMAPPSANVAPPPPPPVSDPRWPTLPAATAAKLGVLDSAQANLIAQVLTLSAEQVAVLPGDQRVLYDNLKMQYM